MQDKEKNILGAAVNVFTKYGVKRSTMHDIAEEAGIARQTLYNSFQNKDAVMLGAIQLYTEETVDAIQSHCKGNGTLADGLDIVFEHVAFKPYELIRNTPHGQDLLEGFNTLAKEQLDNSYAQFRKAAEGLYIAHADALSAIGMTPEKMADYTITSVSGFKHLANDRDHLVGLLGSFKTMTLSMIGQS
ncbi:MAG: TetR/AcrR family transcriptional regulator [Pseudomonadota bacterium]